MQGYGGNILALLHKLGHPVPGDINIGTWSFRKKSKMRL
jgi:hypothetical protein